MPLTICPICGKSYEAGDQEHASSCLWLAELFAKHAGPELFGLIAAVLSPVPKLTPRPYQFINSTWAGKEPKT